MFCQALTDERAGQLLHALKAVTQHKKHSTADTAAAADSASYDATARGSGDLQQLESNVVKVTSSECALASETAKRKCSLRGVDSEGQQRSVPWAQFKGMAAADEYSCAPAAKRARASESEYRLVLS
jgi:hypothetical protein